MRKKGIFNYPVFAGVLACLFLLASCERKNYDIQDPSLAGTWTHYDTTNGLPGNTVTGIKCDNDGNLWMTFEGQGAARYTNGTWTIFKTNNSAILSNVTTCLTQTENGTIIIGTSNGVSFLTGSNAWSSYIDLTSTMKVTAVKVGSDGSIWVGTADQGFYVNRGTGFVKTKVDLWENINTIEEDNSGNVWIGTNRGIIKWNGTSLSFLTTYNGATLPNKKISCLRSDGTNRIWIGTNGGRDVAWVDNAGLHNLSLLNGRDSTVINDIFRDRSGNVWFATARDGLVCYNGIIPRSYRIADGLPEDQINVIGEDKDGNLWFGLKNKGVVKYTLPIYK